MASFSAGPAQRNVTESKIWLDVILAVCWILLMVMVASAGYVARSCIHAV